MAQAGVSLAFVAAKLARPEVGRVPLRPETVAAFRQALRRRLTLVCAPAGYGKTTAVASVITRSKLNTIWYKLDVLDYDPARFLMSFTHAIRRSHPRFGEILLDRLQGSAETMYPTDEMATDFVAECQSHIRTTTYFVLDDFHEAADSNTLLWTLDYLLCNLPSCCRFIILSRYEPTLPLGKLRLAGSLGLIGVDLLRFDSERAATVMKSHTSVSLPDSAIDHLVGLTEGWPASLVMASFALEWLGLDSLEKALSDPRLKQDIYSYLAEQVYSRQSESTRHFLEQTCVLEHVTSNLGNILAGIQYADRELRRLTATQSFTFETENEGTYRYHNLFRDYLRHHFLQSEGTVAFHRLEIRTIEALETCEEAELAVDLSLTMNEPMRALEIVARTGDPGFENYRSQSLASWVSRLDWSTASFSPWTLLLRGQLAMRQGEFDTALSHIRNALAEFDRSANRLGRYHSHSAEECVLFWKGNLKEASESCQLALSYADTVPRRAHSLISLGSAAQELRDWDRAEMAYGEAERLIVGVESPDHQRLRALKALMHYYMGDVRTAHQEIQGALITQHASSTTALILNSVGLFEMAMADYGAAQSHFEDALEAAEQYGNRHFIPVIHDCLGVCLGAKGQTDDAVRLLKESAASETISSDSASLAISNSHIGSVLRRAGRLEEAYPYYELAARTIADGRDYFVQLNCSANLAFAESLLGHVPHSSLDFIANMATRRRLHFVALKSRLFEVALQMRSNDDGNAQGALKGPVLELLQLGHLHFLSQEALSNPGLLAPLLSIVESEPNAEKLIELLLSTRSEERRPCLDASPLRSLSARELQVLALMASGARNEDIAQRLFVAPATVKTHVNHIFSKLGAKDRVQAVLTYVQWNGSSQ